MHLLTLIHIFRRERAIDFPDIMRQTDSLSLSHTVKYTGTKACLIIFLAVIYIRCRNTDCKEMILQPLKIELMFCLTLITLE